MVSKFPIEGRLIVAACESNGGIGMDGALPWPNLTNDMKNFKAVTNNHAVVMGRRTYESIPLKYRPLPNRLSIVLSSKSRTELSLPDPVLLAGSFIAAHELLKAHGRSIVYVIGGESVYREAFRYPEWSTRVYLTSVLSDFDVDTFFPMDALTKPESPFTLLSISSDHCDNGVNYTFKEYARRSFEDTGVENSDKGKPIIGVTDRHEEHQYLDSIRRILGTGVSRGDRTGTGTVALFGEHMRFSLRESFPLLTTKRVFWRGVVEELLWFLKGRTNANELAEKKVHIWDANGSRQFLDSRGFSEREVGDLGPVYGFQWRHFGATYTDMHADYTGKGVDQLTEVIETIRKNPNDRRMIMTAWNPAATDQMALPPCHLLCQFFVANGELSCQMYQRSCDMGLGVPFNIASYALLTCLIADVTGLKRGDFIHVLGDTHVYKNHVDALQQQLLREPRPFPKLHIQHRDDIEEFGIGDITLEGYDPHGALPMKMAV